MDDVNEIPEVDTVESAVRKVNADTAKMNAALENHDRLIGWHGDEPDPVLPNACNAMYDSLAEKLRRLTQEPLFGAPPPTPPLIGV